MLSRLSYRYLTSCGLDSELALSTLLIFFAFTLDNVQAPNGRGDTIGSVTMDAQDTAVQTTVSAGGARILVPLCGRGGRPIYFGK
jgi:hypothetical protein